MPARAYIGTSGWQYDHWRAVFYPAELPAKRWFAHYAASFDTVEVNNTFYRLPQPKVFDAWRGQAPPGFLYVLKFSRYGSHIRRLMDPQATIGLFMERAGRLGDRLGPILVQLPPKWRVDVPRLSAFLAAAPRRQRWAVEFRDPSWLCREVFGVLADHNAALCIHDLIDQHPREITADWAYLRFHGDRYAGSYSHAALAGWAKEIRHWLGRGLDVHAYFNNDAQGHAVANALELRSAVGRRARAA